MKYDYHLISCSLLIIGCSSSIPNLTQDESLIVKDKATVYGVIQNSKKDVHLVIGEIQAKLKGKQIRGDEGGLFVIQLDSGTYEFYNDVDEVIKTSKIYENPPSPLNELVEMKSEFYPHHKITVDKGTISYVGSLFLTRDNMEINFEKNEADALMRRRFPTFKKLRPIENYPMRLASESEKDNEEEK